MTKKIGGELLDEKDKKYAEEFARECFQSRGAKGANFVFDVYERGMRRYYDPARHGADTYAYLVECKRICEIERNHYYGLAQ
jgi:hypothetical protein